MKQLTLNFPPEPTLYEQSGFIVANSNLCAYQHVTKNLNWPDKRLIILGPEKSGKTFLANIFKQNTNAEFISLQEDIFNYQAKNLILEDIDKLKSEVGLFHLLNFCHQESKNLLMTASSYPRFQLLDLKSRINTTYKIIIKNPDETLIKALLLKSFNARQIKAADEVIDYILNRSHRNTYFIHRLVELISIFSLSEKRSITIPLVKLILEKILPENLKDET